MRTLSQKTTRVSILYSTALILGIAVGLLIIHWKFSVHVAMVPQRLITVKMNTPPGAQPSDSRGHENAPIKLEEFSDFQCPPCRTLDPELKKLEAHFTDNLQVTYRHFPITALHKNAMRASEASEAAGLQGRFWEMHDQLFEHQKTWGSSSDATPLFLSYARALNLDLEKFQKDLSGPSVRARIQADEMRAESMDLPGTPIVFINGAEVPPDEVDYEGLTRRIDSLIGNHSKEITLSHEAYPQARCSSSSTDCAKAALASPSK